jgi:hypothetical protein
LFYGSLLADEPWEALEIMAAEVYGVFETMVFVESNRTQMFYHRPWRWVNHEDKLEQLYGTRKAHFRAYVNETKKLIALGREHAQRQEILKGWKEMGMTTEDVGILSDADETFTRDFLRAMQQCPDIPQFDYKSHHCQNELARITATSQVYESSPDCVIDRRGWYHPNALIGACIEEIGSTELNSIAPRVGLGIFKYDREDGYGDKCRVDRSGYTHINGTRYPLYSAADYRKLCGGKQSEAKKDKNHSKFTGYHFHNFFPDMQATRFKYLTYGHEKKEAMTMPIANISEDLLVMSQCAKNVDDHADQKWKRVIGGIAKTRQPWPIYFWDEDYRLRKHEKLLELVAKDEEARLARAAAA